MRFIILNIFFYLCAFETAPSPKKSKCHFLLLVEDRWFRQ